MTARRFPPPWSVDEATETFCIRDANGQADHVGRPKPPPLERPRRWLSYAGSNGAMLSGPESSPISCHVSNSC
jgi:hypothetical protein